MVIPKIRQEVLDVFVRQIEESNARDQRILKESQCHYFVFDYMDDSEMVYVEEDIEQFRNNGRYCITPFNDDQNEAQYKLIRNR